MTVPSIPNPIADGEGPRNVADKANTYMPPVSEPLAEKLGHATPADSAKCRVPASQHSSDPRIQDIMALARERAYWMQMRLRNTARLAAEIRRHLQPARGQEEEWSEETKSEALKFVSEAVKRAIHEIESQAKVLAGKAPRARKSDMDHPLLEAQFVKITARSLAEYELTEDAVLAKMVDAASTFPIAQWVDSPERKGFTLAGLAIIIGHVGHPLDYPKKGHLWKRLGLAPYQKDGVTRAGSSWGKFGGLGKEDWIALGYKKQRLGDIFGKITTPLRYAQWRGVDTVLPYGLAYGKYKAGQIEKNEAGLFAEEAALQAASAKKAGIKPRKELLEGKLTAMAIERRALRYMTKKLIADLWFAWRRLDQSLSADKARSDVSTAAESIEGEAISRLPYEAIVVVPNPQSPFPGPGHQRRAEESLPFPAGVRKPKRAAKAIRRVPKGHRNLADAARPNRRKANKQLPALAKRKLPISDLIAAE
jgi:hypothetical protein